MKRQYFYVFAFMNKTVLVYGLHYLSSPPALNPQLPGLIRAAGVLCGFVFWLVVLGFCFFFSPNAVITKRKVNGEPNIANKSDSTP